MALEIISGSIFVVLLIWGTIDYVVVKGFDTSHLMKNIFTLIICFFWIASNAQVPNELYERINKIRKKHLLRPLTRSSELELKSEKWLIQMDVKHNKLVHDWSSKEAEVLTNCDDPVQCWMSSKPHKKILLSRKLRKIGIAHVNGNWCARLF